ncbi:MAG: M23 family metallopeptidase [Calditrichia bacterium]
MEKKKLIYINQKTSDVKEFNVSFRFIAAILGVLAVLMIIFFRYSVAFGVNFTQNSQITQLKKENMTLKSELERISGSIADIRSSIDVIEDKDDLIRSMLDLPPIASDVRQVGIGGTNLSTTSDMELGELSFGNDLIENLNVLEKIEREIRLEKASYQKLLTTVERQQDSLRYLPCLKPVVEAYISSGFGNRRHPIRKRMHFHRGVDMAATRGTPIIAPADGFIVSAGRNGGYGNYVKINHKYGFETCYGHLNKIYVRNGQFVRRGDKIGEVGSTGLSTSSHLHYELLYNGKHLNPVNFFLNDMTK